MQSAYTNSKKIVQDFVQEQHNKHQLKMALSPTPTSPSSSHSPSSPTFSSSPSFSSIPSTLAYGMLFLSSPLSTPFLFSITLSYPPLLFFSSSSLAPFSFSHLFLFSSHSFLDATAYQDPMADETRGSMYITDMVELRKYSPPPPLFL